MEHKIKKTLVLSGYSFLCLTFFAQEVNAQMTGTPWGFAQQNRASIAALMKSIEDTDSSTTATTATTATGVTNLVCGSDGSSSAKGSSSCIILNNSDGSILLDQVSDGDQNATSTETTNVEETINGADDILAVLNGNE